MIIEALIISMILILITGNKIKKTVNFNSIGLYISLSGLLVGILNFIFTSFYFRVFTEFFIKNYYYSHLLSLLLLLAGLIFNHRLAGFKVLALGLFANIVPIIFNGKMPVDEASLISINNQEKYYIIKEGLSLSHGIFEDPSFKILSDIIALKPPYPFARVISIGDIIISIGIIMYIYNLKEQR